MARSSIFLFLTTLIFFTSCNRQNVLNNSQNQSSTNKTPSNISGKSIKELDKSIPVIFQDTKNNFWFGSKDQGVYKYDGKSLLLFTKKDGLCDNSILGIQEDQLGNIYFDTQEGVSKFDGQQFTTLPVVNSPLLKNEWKLKPNDLWFRMGWDKSGPYRYDGESLYPLTFPETNQADIYYSSYHNDSFNPYGIYTLYKDRKGHLWFGTAALGLCRYDGKSVSWLYENHLTETPSGGAFGIRSIIEDKEGYFWFCNTRYRYNILMGSTTINETSQINYSKENGIGRPINTTKKEYPYFMSIAEDSDGDLWMATYNEGVLRNNGKELLHYPIKDGEKGVLLFSIYKDRQGVLWLGTHNAGVYKFNGRTFEKFVILK